jgi:hypothetical protein
MSVETLSSVHQLLHVERRKKTTNVQIQSIPLLLILFRWKCMDSYIRPAARSMWEYGEFNVSHFEIKYVGMACGSRSSRAQSSSIYLFIYTFLLISICPDVFLKKNIYIY